ncbi:MAG: hypothetical protein K8I27_00090 [Planctomycetes bacterium]|nr:hypothetical protein [Planctomycetota bacterium]
MANPTIVGGTRTIRRADIDPGSSTRDEPVSRPSAEVDMTGGASVLRKEETVIGAPPAVGVSAPGTRAPVRRGGTGAPRPAPSGRPMPPGMGPPRKKNNMPLMLGIGGGVVGLILIVVLVVVFSDTGTTTPGPDGGDTVAAGNSPAAQQGADERLLEDMKKAFNNVDALSLDQVRFYYEEARGRRDNAEFKSMQDQFARHLVRKTESGASVDQLADIALMLSDDKNPSADLLLEKAWAAMDKAGKATKEEKRLLEDGSEKKTLVVVPKFKDIVTRVGWVEYQYPEEMNLCIEYEVAGASDYSAYYNFDILQIYRDAKLFPPDIVEKLQQLEEVALGNWADLNARDAKDGYAKKSRKAWIRFRAAHKAGKVDRTKGQRSFSPRAMERENEEFDEIWTYTYGPSLMVFVEKPLGRASLDEDFLETLESKKALLQQLVAWFDERLVTKFNLKRVKPKDNAELAQKEGWPMEIVVFKDSATFAKHYLDTNKEPIPPGARAYYSPLDQRVMTYDDRADSSPDTQWFNESVIIHETFHMLSDFYAANPMFERDDMMKRPRYANILVQEGLTDSVAGFLREGMGEDAKYDFLRLNHLRLRSFQQIYEILGKDVLYRIRDTIECRHYGQCDQKAYDRLLEKKWKVNGDWLMGNARGVFYATACQISYFFEHYKENGKYPYRDKWWEYIAKDYKGEISVNSWTDTVGITKFKEVFGIKTDADWDALEQKWIDYTMSLNPEDVGKGGDDIKEDSIGPDIAPPPPYEGSFLPGGGQNAALPSRREREEEEVLVG